MKITEKCLERSIQIVRNCATSHGLYASCARGGYSAVWSRDSMISMIGASVVDDPIIKDAFKQSLITLAQHQSKRGQIPNAVDKWSKRAPHVDFATIDSSLWFVIGHHVYKARYGGSLFKKYKKSIDKAIFWLDCQDIGENGLLEQLPTTDWQDAFPHKYGNTINTQALYYKVLNLIGDKSAVKVQRIVNEQKGIKLWYKDFYVAYRWKNHGKYKEYGDWFDSLGNLLAIVFGLADDSRAKKILSYIEKEKINKPYPVRAIHPPMTKKSKYWYDYFNDCDARKPNQYLNGGIWPFIGGFYVLALIKLGKFNKAKKELEKLAKANLDGNFPEWINPITKESFGKEQAWDAGMYILAYESLRKKKVLI